MTDAVELTIGGNRHGGWTSVSISRSMETVAGTFDLTLSERWPGAGTTRPIQPGARCTVAIGGDDVITGFIDEAAPSFDAGRHQIRVAGRDATGDLVDCSAANEPGEWKDRDLTQLAAAICEPFGIAVTAAADVGAPFMSFRIEQGETAFEAIERACRMRAVLPMSDGLGGLLLTRAGGASRAGSDLASGKTGNVLAAEGRYSQKDRYSEIIVKGQRAGDDHWSPEDNAEPHGKAVDATVRRHRPLILLAEDQGDAADLTRRAAWEASVRRARARAASVTVQGWRDGAGALWRPNSLIHADIPELGLDAEMLIVAVTLTLNGEGSLATLDLAPPRAFELIAIAEDVEEDLGW